jgi:small-conductance mechanosensitive channel
LQHVIDWVTAHIRPETVAGTVGLLIVGGAAILLISRVLRTVLRRVDSRLHLPYDTMLLVMRFVAGALWIVLALVILEFWGVSVAGLWTFLVSVGALIGVGFLATWAMVSNATATLFITIWRPFRLGQDVEMLPENLKGRVIDRNLMFTALREQNGTILQIPNNLFFQKMFRVTAGEQYLFEFLEREQAEGGGGTPQMVGEARAPERN